MVRPKGHANRYVTKDDFSRNDTAESVCWLAPRLEHSENVFRGRIGFLTLRDGLTVHFSNAEDLHDLKTEAECGPRLSVSVFLEGAVDARVGDLPIPMPRYHQQQAQWQPVATVFAQARTERFIRQAHKGMRLRKVSISVTPQWLRSLPLGPSPDRDAILAFSTCHLACRSWSPSPHAVALAEQIINSPDLPPLMQTLYFETRVLGLLEEAFAEILGATDAVLPGTVGSRGRQKLQAIDRYLEVRLGQAITAAELAREVGLSLSTLQRLLSNAHGTTASKYIRHHKLEKARLALERDDISVGEAAYLVGYGSPANFATAFKRYFGLSPSAVQHR